MEKEIVGMRMVGDYIACSNGRIFKLNWHKTGKTKEVKQSKDTKGYLQFYFINKLVQAHRFIATCFIPNPNNLLQINHKNEIKTDNRVENLEWCDAKYNNNYGTRRERMCKTIKGKQINRKDASKVVLQFTTDGEFVAEYPSTMEVQRKLGFCNGQVGGCCRDKIKQAYGYIWRYKEDV